MRALQENEPKQATKDKYSPLHRRYGDELRLAPSNQAALPRPVDS